MIGWPTSHQRIGRTLIHFVTRLLLAAYLTEAGLLLVLAPWTALWERNFFALSIPAVGEWMASGFARGGVTGVGLVTTVVGLRDLAATLLGRGGDAIPDPPRSES